MDEFPKLVEILKVSNTKEGNGVYSIDLVIQFDAVDGPVTEKYLYRPEGIYGLSPNIRKWLEDNPDFPIDAYVPPPEKSIEEIRAEMPSITARQLRLGLVGNGYPMSQVSAVIDAMPEGADKETARIEWEYATTFERTHPLIGTVGAALAIGEEQIDTMWTAAASL
ncbi:hypothetical protein I7F13_05065 [Sinorhizobium meliloti]|uniref:hypothetical protein n=1 Tax=Rhizobium meliloti TaxID=382 RepID=UPI000FDCC7D3|nr:hypothetical protein [Sinorhizobium meliloti]MDE3821801.1 hypothetical protein [Sinorhizobium meliloti]RVM47222.1 hypothetical protein CN127_18925 [Sinorhizobium meliloti]RVN75550.1 hypothetical protein CN106_00910 [Sinorhizobium meliloti]